MRKLLAIFAAAALFGLVNSSFAATREDADDCRSSNVVAERIAACTRIIETKGERPRDVATAYRERGDAHHQLGDDDGANADYDAALAADPSYDLAFISRANVAAEVGLYDSAVTDYTSAIKLDRRAAVFRSRGRAYALEYAYTEALSDFTTCIAIDPKDALCFFNRGIVRDFLGEKADATADFKQGLKLDPKNVNAQRELKRITAGAGTSEEEVREYLGAYRTDLLHAP